MPSNGSYNGYSRSPADSNRSSVKGSPSSNTKVKVSYKDDIFVILLPFDIDYQGLMERVERKIRLCAHSTNEITSFRIRYKDEDGDLITINSNEDIQMALELNEDGGVLTLFAAPANR